jgi:hypothetical protein
MGSFLTFFGFSSPCHLPVYWVQFTMFLNGFQYGVSY